MISHDGVQLQEARTARDVEEFIGVPWNVYPGLGDTRWIPPLRIAQKTLLDVEKNPFYKRAAIQLFIARKGGKSVGRIAAIENRAHVAFHGEQVGFYGFFESIRDQAVANALFDAASGWLKARGLQAMRGPVSPSTNHECGLLVRGQSQHPTLMTPWNPKYYEELHLAAGLNGVKDLVAYFLASDDVSRIPAKVFAKSDRIKRESRFSFRDLNLRRFASEIDTCFDIYNSAWEKNWGFIPMTREEFQYMGKELRPLLDPRLAFIAEQDGKPAGFMIAVPDYNHVFKRIHDGRLLPFGWLKILAGRYLLKSVRILALGVKPEYQREGLLSLFTHEAFLRGSRHGYMAGEASWILEDNEGMNRPWRELGAPLYRRWRIYERACL